jgi:trk system potassium uptake protein TrkA
MKILIIGDGKVGRSLAEQLSRDVENEITIIDKDGEALRESMETLDVQCVKGNGMSTSTLLEAGVGETELLIAATSSDERNMVCCLTAKKLGAEHTIARIRNPEYADELSRLRLDLGLDMVINPEQAVAGEIVKLLVYPAAAHVEMFAGGRVEMAEVSVKPGMPILNQTVLEIGRRLGPSGLVGAILRGGEVIIPGGSDRCLDGDRLFVIGEAARVYRFCSGLAPNPNKVRNVMVVGGGRVAYYLGKFLDEIDVKVKILEIDPVRCAELTEALPQALVLRADGSDDRVLASEHLSEMDGFVAVTGMDEENLMTALLAKHYGVPKVVAKITRTGYGEVIAGLGVDHIVDPRATTTQHILRHVYGMKNARGVPINSLYHVADNMAQAVEFTANKSTRFLDIPMKKLKLQRGVLFAAIVRGNEIIIPHGTDAVRLWDDVIMLTRGQNFADLNDILAEEIVE